LLAPVMGAEITCQKLLPVVINSSKDRWVTRAFWDKSHLFKVSLTWIKFSGFLTSSSMLQKYCSRLYRSLINLWVPMFFDDTFEINVIGEYHQCLLCRLWRRLWNHALLSSARTLMWM
jgi:hypothetical protein